MQQLGNQADGVDLMPDDVMPILPEWRDQLLHLDKLKMGTTR